MRVDIEYIRWLKAELNAVNEVPFESIEWYEHNKPILHNKEMYDSFRYIGLNNCDYVISDLYKGVVETTKYDTDGNVTEHTKSVSPYDEFL